MRNINRRNFLTSVLGASVATSTSVLFAASVAPDPNDSDDPNAVVDLDGEIGKPYRGWKEGEFDLHFIHTGVGENCFQIFPDGTTALVDCGDWDVVAYKGARACVPAPNDSKRPGEWVARYVARLLPDLKEIDYVIASHFH